MQTTLTIQITPAKDWSGDILFTFTPAPEPAFPGLPGKEAGDIRLIEIEGKPGLKGSVSLGPEEKIVPELLRHAGAAIGKWAAKNEAASVGVDLSGLENLGIPDPADYLAEGMLLGAFQFDLHKSGAKAHPQVIVHLLAEDGKDLQQKIERVAIVAEAVNLAREWAHEPPNVINPITLAERVDRFASENGLKCTVFDEKQLAEMGAGAIYSVGIGSKTPSRLIILEYPGSHPEKEAQPVALVGKAITFDTGGYSLKDLNGMLGMKYDKCGGMAVLGILLAAARLGLDIPLVGLIAAAENMVSDKAYRPSDIITTLSGKTVEIINADAEGRLVLCDALTYAQQHYHPHAMIDLATLTGGVVVALGHFRAGMMTNNDQLADELMRSGERTHELLWPFPLDDEYTELIKGDDSDIKNFSSREAQSIIGGIFLKQFISNDVPWAHLDIAGVAKTEKDLPYSPKGATGFGIRLLLDYLQNLE